MKTKNKFQPEHLNQNLVARNNVSYTSQIQLCELYDKLEVLLLSSKGELLTRADYDIVSDKVTELEFELQRLWGFPQDKEFHKYWLNIGSCTCPKMDNMDRLGYGRIINLGCPVHGTPQEV